MDVASFGQLDFDDQVAGLGSLLNVESRRNLVWRGGFLLIRSGWPCLGAGFDWGGDSLTLFWRLNRLKYLADDRRAVEQDRCGQ